MMDSKNAQPYSFSVLCAKFIEHKRALGCKYDTEASIVQRLMQFGADFFETSDMTKIHLTREFVEAWVERKPYEAPRTQEPRIVVVRGLAMFLQGLGIDAYVLPTRRFPTSSFKPYIFTHEQVDAILRECVQQVCGATPDKNHATYVSPQQGHAPAAIRHKHNLY